VPTKPYNWQYDASGVAVQRPFSNFPIVVLELESQRQFPVPFDIKDRVVRNLRLKDQTLIIEWAERDPYHALNDSEEVHRHFISCCDVKAELTPSDATPSRRSIIFRGEWKLYFLGLPLNHQDRFFSTHIKDQYSVYLWKPNRSMYTRD
jgi:hypothetical protein